MDTRPNTGKQTTLRDEPRDGSRIAIDVFVMSCRPGVPGGRCLPLGTAPEPRQGPRGLSSKLCGCQDPAPGPVPCLESLVASCYEPFKVASGQILHLPPQHLCSTFRAGTSPIASSHPHRQLDSRQHDTPSVSNPPLCRHNWLESAVKTKATRFAFTPGEGLRCRHGCACCSRVRQTSVHSFVCCRLR